MDVDEQTLTCHGRLPAAFLTPVPALGGRGHGPSAVQTLISAAGLRHMETQKTAEVPSAETDLVCFSGL